MPAPNLLEGASALFAWAPGWVFSLLLIAFALALALWAYHLAVGAVRRGLRKKDAVLRSIVLRTRGPARLALIIGAISWAVQAAPLAARPTRLVQHGLLVAFIVLCGWALMTMSDIILALYLRRWRMDAADNLEARKLLTQTRILRRSANGLVLIATIAMALMTIPGVKQLGVSLLAAGGAAGIILGLALQPVLSNLIAGVQLALTQPIRIDDAVFVENEFGWVEEINATYVVIRIWDLRRMVVPLKYFLDQPFQNWTRQSADLLGTTMFYLDYAISIDRFRAKFEEVVKASPLWDGKACAVQVTDLKERVVEVRGLVSAAGAGTLFDLRVYVREKMIAWLAAEAPEGLPRDRQVTFLAEEARASEPPSPAVTGRRVQ